jgi:hypothetical protein
MSELRVVEIEQGVTIGLVHYDPAGCPSTVAFVGILDSFDLPHLSARIELIRKALTKPILKEADLEVLD